jgi:hypothetical protein
VEVACDQEKPAIEMDFVRQLEQPLSKSGLQVIVAWLKTGT